MESMVRATCPKCRSSLRIPAQWLGQAVRCKKCGAQVRAKPRPPGGPSPDDTAPNTPLPPAAAAPAPNAFDFDRPSDPGPDPFGFPAPVPAPVPYPAPAPAVDANGYPLPYPAPAGYPVPPGYPAPPAGYPVPPGYPPPGYGPPPALDANGYPLPPGYGPPAGYPYAPPPGYPAAPGYPAPAPYPAAHGRPAFGPPVPPSGEFKLDSDDAPRPARKRRGGPGAAVWVGLCLLMTAGLVAGGLYLGGVFPRTPADGGPAKGEGDGNKPNPDGGGQAGGPTPAGPAAGKAHFPRRLLFISVTKYMYLNPLTSGVATGAKDRPAAAADALAFHWRVPREKDNDQSFVLSDTLGTQADRLPMKGVVQGTYGEFFRTSRAQDRVFVYFGGHAVEKDGKAYLAPVEAELDGDGWQATLIPLDHFYAELKKCPAAQKVVVWDVCRLNPEKGKVRPGSEPMSEGLYRALTAAPPGVQVITTCKPGENALEFTQLRPDGFSGPLFSGSAFLESVRFVIDPARNRLPKASPSPADPLPVPEWHAAVAKRVTELGALAEKVGSGGKQTVALAGAPPAALAPPDPAEAAAARFPLPQAPKGASPAEVKALEGEFHLPPLRPGLSEVGLSDFPFPADALKEYAADVPLAAVKADPEKYKLRAAVADVLDKLRDKWSAGAGATRIRETVAGPINDALKNEVKKEQEFWAVSIAELELELLRLEGLAAERKDEPSKRWQAHYDFALAALKARLAYMNEYNKLLGNLVTESLPALDPKLGQDGYTLVASDTLKSGKEIKKMAEEAQALFGEIVTNYKGSPWAIQAKQEKAVAIGLNWKPASLKKE